MTTEPGIPKGRLSHEELAFEADVPGGTLDEMVAAGIFGPDADGLFPARYVRRVAHIRGLLASGLDLGFVKDLIDRGLGDFDAGDQLMPHPGRRSKRTLAEFVASLGPREELFHQVFAVLGFTEPGLDRRLWLEDEAVLERFLQAFGDNPIAAVRSARLMAAGIRPAVEGMAKLQVDRLARLYARGWRVSQASSEELEEMRAVVRVAFEMATWLMKRYLEQAIAASNVDMVERSLALQGLTSPIADHRAIVFADLTGYTALTNELGDERGALAALRLRDEVEPLARANHGRLLQLLGDGAMLFFTTPSEAIAVAAELMRRWPDDLPRLHVGIGIGPLYERDGAFFGSTVNLAARLSSAAHAGQILAASIAGNPVVDQPGLTSIGPLTLKGFPNPVAAVEVSTSWESM